QPGAEPPVARRREPPGRDAAGGEEGDDLDARRHEHLERAADLRLARLELEDVLALEEEARVDEVAQLSGEGHKVVRLQRNSPDRDARRLTRRHVACIL